MQDNTKPFIKFDEGKPMYHLIDNQFYKYMLVENNIEFVECRLGSKDLEVAIMNSLESKEQIAIAVKLLIQMTDYFTLLEGLAKVLTFGAAKYEENNWRKCENVGQYFSAAMRHFVAHSRGEEVDSETGLPHLFHITTNLMIIYCLGYD